MIDPLNLRSILAGLCVGLTVLASPLVASDTTKAMLDSYLKIHEALTHDRLDGVKPESAAIVAQASRLGADGQAIRAAAQKLSDAKDLKAARDAFGSLSDELIKRATAEGWKDVADAKVAYCPMANKSWIQKADKIQNPYYGTAMPGCGSFTKK